MWGWAPKILFLGLWGPQPSWTSSCAAGGQQEMLSISGSSCICKAFSAKERVFWCCRISPGHRSKPDLVLCLVLCSPPTRGHGSRDMGDQVAAKPAREEPSSSSAGLCCHPTSERHPACALPARAAPGPAAPGGCSNILDTWRIFAGPVQGQGVPLSPQLPPQHLEPGALISIHLPH